MNVTLQPKLAKPDVYTALTRLFLSLFLTVLSLVGCGHADDSPKLQNLEGHYVAPAELAPYVDEFLAAASAHAKPIDPAMVGKLTVIYDETLPGTVVGRCEQWETTGAKVIRIKKSRWGTVDEATRQSLTFHELGHCFLGRKHDDTTVNRGGLSQAASLMSTEIVRGDVFTGHRDEYLSELFK